MFKIKMQTLKIMAGIALTGFVKLYTDYYTKFTIVAEKFKDLIGVMRNCPSIRKGYYNPTI